MDKKQILSLPEIDKTDCFYMKKALQLSKKAAQIGEVPIGALIVYDGKIIATGYNKRETKHNALHHAEIIAIDRACRALGRWRLHGCTLYVTCEPCPMCAGAVVNARLDRVVYGCSDQKAGAYGGLFDINTFSLNHFPAITGGVLKEECAKRLSDFFCSLREKRAAEKNTKGKGI